MYNVELKEYFEERYKREFRHNTIGSRSETCLYSEILFPLYKQNIIDFREKLVTQLKVPEIAGEKYTYKNLELVYYKCGQYWKKMGTDWMLITEKNVRRRYDSSDLQELFKLMEGNRVKEREIPPLY